MTFGENHEPANAFSHEEKQKILDPRRAREVPISGLK